MLPFMSIAPDKRNENETGAVALRKTETEQERFNAWKSFILYPQCNGSYWNFQV